MNYWLNICCHSDNLNKVHNSAFHTHTHLTYISDDRWQIFKFQYQPLRSSRLDIRPFFPGPYPSPKSSTDSEMPETAQVCEEKRRYQIDCWLFLEVALRESPTLLFEPLELHDVWFLEFHKKRSVFSTFLTYRDVQEHPSTKPTPQPLALSLSIDRFSNPQKSPPKLQLTVRHGHVYEWEH